MNNKLNLVNVGIGFVILVVICVFISIVIFLLGPSQRGQGNGTSSSSSSSASSSGSSATSSGNISMEELEFVGIAGNQDISALNSDGDMVSIEIDNLNWQNIKFSPAGNFISVLGQNGEISNYDLFIFNLPEIIREKLTVYEDAVSGVDNYEWQNETTLVFTQGQGNQKWLHKLNLNDKSVIKDFVAPGELVDVNDTNYLFMNQQSLIMTNLEGDQVLQTAPTEYGFEEFSQASLFSQGLVITGSSELVGEKSIFVNSEEIIVEIDLPLACVQNQVIAVDTTDGKLELLGLTDGFRQSEVLFSRLIDLDNAPVLNVTTCNENRVVFSLSFEGRSSWFSIENGAGSSAPVQVEQLIDFADYLEVTGV